MVREVLCTRDADMLWTLQILANCAGPAADVLVGDILAVVRTRPLDGTVGRFAGLALGRLGSAAVGPLLEVLGESDLQMHNAVMWAFTVLGPQAKPAIPALLRILDERPRYERAPEPADYRGAYVAWGVPNLAVEALGNIVGPDDLETIPALLAALHGENELARRAAARGLGRIGLAARIAEADLEQALRDSSDEVRLAAREALERIRV